MPRGLASYGFTSSSSSSVASAFEIDTDCSAAAAADNDCSTATAARAGSSNVKRRKTLALKYKPEWKQRFLMWPACSSSRFGEDADDEMICAMNV